MRIKMYIEKKEQPGINLATLNKQEFIESYRDCEVLGIKVLLWVYKKETSEKTKGGIIIPDMAKLEDVEYLSISALVLGMGKDAYKDTKQFPSGPYVNIGDWVFFSRKACDQFYLKDMLCVIVDDYKIDLRLPSPDIIKK